MNVKNKVSDRKNKASILKKKITVVLIALKKKETPIYAKIIAAITIGYALSPIDLIPDFVPVLGYLDDIVILPVLIAICIKLIPKDMIEACEEEAKEIWNNGKPKRWYYAIPILLLWLFVIVIILKLIM